MQSQFAVQTITTHLFARLWNEESASCRVYWSLVIRNFIVVKVRDDTKGDVVIPARDPVAQICDRRLIKPVFSKILVGEDADPGEMVPDCLQVEVRIMTAGADSAINSAIWLPP